MKPKSGISNIVETLAGILYLLAGVLSLISGLLLIVYVYKFREIEIQSWMRNPAVIGGGTLLIFVISDMLIFRNPSAETWELKFHIYTNSMIGASLLVIYTIFQVPGDLQSYEKAAFITAGVYDILVAFYELFMWHNRPGERIN